MSWVPSCVTVLHFAAHGEEEGLCFAGAGYVFGIFCVINLAIWAAAGFMGASATSLAMKTFR